MSTKTTIGVVAISYNEEVDMPGFLNHLVDWVDEIVIVDDGSSDNTEQIASQYGSKVNFIKSKRLAGEYYADQRNKGIDNAKSDWLLHMDIDERVTKELADEIISAISSTAYEAYRFRRLNYFFHRPMKGGGWADWNLVHLAKKEVFRFGGMFHETTHLTIGSEKVGQLSNKMHHFNDKSYSQRLTKSMTYQEEVIVSLEKRNIKVGFINMVMAILKEFLVKYFYKKGVFDGIPGFISAFHSCFAIFKAYALLWEKQNKIERKELEKMLKNEWEKHK